MGQYIFKEWKETCEEPNVATPITGGNAAIRFLDSDPRSPTDGISRTPIEVESTPKKRMNFFVSGPENDPNGAAMVDRSSPRLKKTNSAPENMQKTLFQRHPLAPTNVNRCNVKDD